ncbi:MAG TPA: hypothetical protein DHU55_03930, partial [Blastocatellia bacterium]|nr:hypothetical protein [Blastocatellia bacterium]
ISDDSLRVGEVGIVKQGRESVLKAGFARVCISPPLGAPLAGFAARLGVSEGIHDDLFARALVLANEASAVALISLDVLALP